MKHPRLMTHKDNDYLDYIRSQKCCVPGCEHIGARVDPHHLFHAHKNHYLCVPLCRVHHTEGGFMSIERFWEKYKVNLCEEVIYYLLNYDGELHL